MKRLLLFMTLFSIWLGAFAQTEFIGDGDGYSWEDPSNWSDGQVPQSGDDISIDGYSVYRSEGGFENYGNLELVNGANLFTQPDILLTGDFMVDSSSSLDVSISDKTIHTKIYCNGEFYFDGDMGMYLEGYAPQIGDSFQIIYGSQGSCGSQTVALSYDIDGVVATFGTQCQTDGISYTVTDVNYTTAIAWDGGGGDTQWGNAANWDPNGVPGPDDEVFINLPGAGGYASAGGVAVKNIFVGSNNTLAINGDLSVASAINNNTDGTVLWNSGALTQPTPTPLKSILINLGNLILDSPGLKELENEFTIWAFDKDIEHNQGNLNINSGTIETFNNVNYNINGDNITIGYTGGNNHTFVNRGGSITKTTGSGTSTISLTNFQNNSNIISNAGTLVFGEGLIENPGSNFGGSGTIGFPSGFVLDSDISPGNSPGILTIAGDLTTNTNATFNIEINGPNVGTDYDRIAIQNNANINANLNVILGYLPPNDALFKIVSAGGTLNAANLPSTIQADYGGDSITFSVAVQNDALFLVGPDGTLGTPSFDMDDLQIFPNPVSDILSIKSPKISNGNWMLFNQLGQTVLKGALENKATEINVKSLNSGFYGLKIKDENNNTIKIKKVIIK